MPVCSMSISTIRRKNIIIFLFIFSSCLCIVRCSIYTPYSIKSDCVCSNVRKYFSFLQDRNVLDFCPSWISIFLNFRMSVAHSIGKHWYSVFISDCNVFVRAHIFFSFELKLKYFIDSIDSWICLVFNFIYYRIAIIKQKKKGKNEKNEEKKFFSFKFLAELVNPRFLLWFAFL